MVSKRSLCQRVDSLKMVFRHIRWPKLEMEAPGICATSLTSWKSLERTPRYIGNLASSAYHPSKARYRHDLIAGDAKGITRKSPWIPSPLEVWINATSRRRPGQTLRNLGVHPWGTPIIIVGPSIQSSIVAAEKVSSSGPCNTCNAVLELRGMFEAPDILDAVEHAGLRPNTTPLPTGFSIDRRHFREVTA